MKITLLLAAISLIANDEATGLRLTTGTKLAKSLHDTVRAQAYSQVNADAHIVDWIAELVTWFEDKYELVMDMVKEYKLKMKKLSWKQKIAKIKAKKAAKAAAAAMSGKGLAETDSKVDVDLKELAREVKDMMNKAL